jgi:hypothetical protein
LNLTDVNLQPAGTRTGAAGRWSRGVEGEKIRQCKKRFVAPVVLSPTPGATGIVTQFGSTSDTVASVLGLRRTEKALNERLRKLGTSEPVSATRIVPVGPDVAWLLPSRVGRIISPSRINTGRISSNAARHDDRCFTREAYKPDFG